MAEYCKTTPLKLKVTIVGDDRETTTDGQHNLPALLGTAKINQPLPSVDAIQILSFRDEVGCATDVDHYA